MFKIHLMILFPLCWTFGSTENNYVKYIDNSPGIYFEKIDNIKYYSSQSDILVFVDLNELRSNTKLSVQIYDKILKFCEGIKQRNTRSCRETLQLIQVQMNSIDKKAEDFYQILNQNEGGFRAKRSLFDIVTPVINIVSGVVDIFRAKKNDKIIKNMIKDHEMFKLDVENKLQMIKSDILNLNETIKRVIHDQNVLSAKVDNMEEYLTELNDKVNQTQKETVFNQQMLIFKSLLDNINDQYNVLTNAVIFARSNQLHPGIINPSTVLQLLQRSYAHISSTLHYMYPLSQEYINEIIAVATMQVYCYEYHLVYILQNPTGQISMFELYRLIPLPARRSDGSYIFIQPKTKYLVIDESKVQYIALDNIGECRKASNFKICLLEHPLSTVHGASNCETELLISSFPVPKSCNIMITYNTYENLHHLQNVNAWLFLYSDRQESTLSCLGVPDSEIILEGIGLLKLPNDCLLRSKSRVIMTTGLYSDLQSFQPLKTNILNDSCCKDLHSEKSEVFHFADLSFDDLKRSSISIAEFERNHESDDGSGKIINVIIGATITVCVILILISILCWRCVLSKRSANNETLGNYNNDANTMRFLNKNRNENIYDEMK